MADANMPIIRMMLTMLIRVYSHDWQALVLLGSRNKKTGFQSTAASKQQSNIDLTINFDPFAERLIPLVQPH